MRRSSGRVDVVDEENRAVAGLRGEGAGDVSAPLGEREAALAARPADPREERLARQPPEVGERPRELLPGGSPLQPVSVGGRE
jgi:hypothetical protein